MKTVRDACKLQPNALNIMVSDQIEQLDELINNQGDGIEFFARTHITHGMRSLFNEGIARLAGASNTHVFHLKQAMGGGKTHSLVAFGLLAKNPELRKKICQDTLYASAFDTAKIAVFYGRNQPSSYFWGEIAAQLGKGDLFNEYWIGGPKAPPEDKWIELFECDQPILILLDELAPYLQYYDAQPIGNGTVADIATAAFANMLTAASKKSNVCVVVSDLAAAFDRGSKLINKALDDATSELGRAERNITPVDMATGEVYEILRKRLFTSLPTQAEIDEVAAAYGRKLEEATKAMTARRGAEAIADEIAATYPFHPKLANIIALFKENEQFKQTRGLLELVSRLLRSVWEREANDVYLIGPQHFDLSIQDVRDKLTEISAMRDVIASDLWNDNHTAKAQVIDGEKGNEAASQVGSLLFIASLSTAVNAVKGLSKEELVECLANPLSEPSDFLASFEILMDKAWYLHHTQEGRYYFDRIENLTKMLEGFAQQAPDNKIDELISKRLETMFRPVRKTAYEMVLPLPKLQDVTQHIRSKRVLLIFSPDSKIPPEEIQKFFNDLPQKNNLLVLTGDKSAMGSVERAARQLFAANMADSRIPASHPQREELNNKQQQYALEFTSTVLNLFDKVLFPNQRAGHDAMLASKPLDMTRDATREFNGEDQIEKTLISNPIKLFLDINAEFDIIRDKAQDYLWLGGMDEVRWEDAKDRYMEIPAMPWLPPNGLDALKSIALNRGVWEDLNNGSISKKPRPKSTSVQVITDTEPDDSGSVRLRINTQNGGPAPRVHYCEEGEVNETSPQLPDMVFNTRAIYVNFLAVDPTGQNQTGDVVKWTNKLVLRNKMEEKDGKRTVELFAAPRGHIRYTLDGREPREGQVYDGPISIGSGEVLLRAFAETGGLETHADFHFQAQGKKGVQIEETKPGYLVHRTGRRIDSRSKTFETLKEAADKSVTLESVVLTIGQGSQVISLSIGEIPVEGPFIESILTKVLEKFNSDTPINLSFRKAHFQSGHDLKDFAAKLGIELTQGDVEQ